jgi:hypothetical protein
VVLEYSVAICIRLQNVVYKNGIGKINETYPSLVCKFWDGLLNPKNPPNPQNLKDPQKSPESKVSTKTKNPNNLQNPKYPKSPQKSKKY